MRKFISILLLLLLCGCAWLAPKQSPPTQTSQPTGRPTVTLTELATETAAPTERLTSMPTRLSPTIMPTPLLTPTLTPLPTLQPNQPILLTSLQMMSPTTGWGVESTGHLLRTTDDGATWRDVTPPQVGVFGFLDSIHAWATLKVSDECHPPVWSMYWLCAPASPVIIWRTEDGGQTWQQNVPFETINNYYGPIAIQFVNAKTGWFLIVDQIGPMGSADMGMYRTDDGGASWTLATHNYSCRSRGMVFTSAQDGWTGTDCRFTAWVGNSLQDFINGKLVPLIQRTSDGGSSWEDFPLPPLQPIPPQITSPKVEGTMIFCGISRITRISGKAFSLESSCSLAEYGASQKPDFIFGYLTPDGGQTWHSWPASGNEFFVNAIVGWRLYPEPDTNRQRLQKTTDSGLTWNTLITVAWETAQFDFISEQVGWAIVTGAGASALVHTTDGGTTWTEIKPVMVARNLN